ncbi:MAG TPA: hypothetical protein DEE98_05180 [Elusimicrobia bacterium]|nr:MAG: hypothetical protein A2278_04855 [Elusimicrobia bacterium RIFOXYA12_FULL_49_49]OGS14624.1 MAG: hypothetical protein A2251_08985 [Elusimicrobia bacterium RIFOXYA2_FULL_47_53]OGS25723.1 MAG: hypothetical protein A2339_06605 [Elusimicrobia bacterium RIFOXYB12_FULL_50_12]OGS31715.1 MAG: hypothetical protein A2323_05895 [Elusimicrobia bacterium RIFOXYB2_FULL_46_23]HBU69758.1 hypothetical protein [Elusimicrobiota bacterium]
MISQNKALLAVAAAALFLSGCGAKYQFEKARKLEAKGYFVEAAIQYENVSKKYPEFEKSPEALLSIGDIYRKRLKIYSHAHRYYRELLEKYPNSKPWAGLAKEGLLNSPDYYPLRAGSFWIEGDSASGGRNMRSEWNCAEVSTGVYSVQRRIFAGARKVTEITRYFKKSGYELLESVTNSFNDSSVILAYPLVTGRQWETNKDGSTVVFRVEAEKLQVTVKAGSFEGCLKISEESQAARGSRKYIYYAPEVGWILTSVAAAGGEEHRNTELLSYKISQQEK